MKELYFKSNDNITDIHAVIWEPNGNIKGIVQIIHGMNEHITMYQKFAEILNKNGYIVCGIDLLGHGDSIIDKEHLGYFAIKDSKNILIEDNHELYNQIIKKYNNFPYFVLGYSLGSIITRNYIEKYSNELNGVLLLSSPYHSNLKMCIAKIQTSLIAFYHHGWFYRSNYLYRKTTGDNNKYFPNELPGSWLTKDKNQLKMWSKDEKNRFKFTCNAYYTMFELLKNKELKQINHNIPIILLCGKNDPCTDFGNDIIKLKNMYIKNQIKNIKYKTYNNLRHSILNDNESSIVINDIITFLNLNILKNPNN